MHVVAHITDLECKLYHEDTAAHFLVSSSVSIVIVHDVDSWQQFHNVMLGNPLTPHKAQGPAINNLNVNIKSYIQCNTTDYLTFKQDVLGKVNSSFSPRG